MEFELPEFQETPAPYIRQALMDFLKIVSPEQLNAWDQSIPPLQLGVGEVLGHAPAASGLFDNSRVPAADGASAPDVILLMGGAVLVLEIKGKGHIDLADVDQASGYARDLRAYHRDCEDKPVHPVLVLMGASGRIRGDRRSGGHWPMTPSIASSGT